MVALGIQGCLNEWKIRSPQKRMELIMMDFLFVQKFKLIKWFTKTAGTH
jgi:hypothetical protein